MKVSIDRKRVSFYLWTGLAYLLLWLLGFFTHYSENLLTRPVNYVWATAYITVLNYLLFEYTLPKLCRKRIGLSLLLVGAHVLLFSIGLYAWRYVGIQLHIYTALKDFDSVAQGAANQMPFGVASIFFFGIVKHIYEYRKLKIATQRLLIEKQQAELNYLKSQTNPHFLFNTLNNIYALTRDKSDLAPESIVRLSQILRFMLYEAGGAYIAIEQELKIISDYIALEKLRYDDSLRVDVNYDIEDMKQAIPPLLLIPLVENAFKHGVAETRDQPFVDIHLSVDKLRLAFIVKNSADAFPPEGGVKENIGLSNLRRQLELLYTDYDLAVEQGESVFTATLILNLASHV